MNEQQTVEGQSWTVLAHLLRPQGRKGEVLAELLTDFPERFRSSPEVLLARPGFTGTASEARAVTVTGFWLPVGKNQGRVVLSIAGIDTITLAETLAGLDVIISDSERMNLEEDAEYISDLVGCTVFESGGLEIGVVESVDFPMSPDGARRLDDAAPLLSVVTEHGHEVLIPFVKDFLVLLDVEARRIEMSLPAGLIELNHPERSQNQQESDEKG